eukprot:2389886-Prymnesium_polylepis.1
MGVGLLHWLASSGLFAEAQTGSAVSVRPSDCDDLPTDRWAAASLAFSYYNMTGAKSVGSAQASRHLR